MNLCRGKLHQTVIDNLKNGISSDETLVVIDQNKFSTEEDRTKYDDRNVLAFVKTVNTQPCSGAVALIKELEHLLKLMAKSIPKRA